MEAGTSSEYGFFNHPFNADLHCLASCSAQHMEGAEMIGLCDLAATRRHWCILTFHGIDVGRLGTCQHAFSELLAHLATHRDRIWTAPVVEVAQFCADRRREMAPGDSG